MSAEKILVKTRNPAGRERAEVWDTERPFALGHPSRYVLERADQGVLIRLLPPKLGRVEGDCSLLVRDASLTPGERHSLPGNLGYSVELAALKPLKPAYHGDTAADPSASHQALAFAGMRRVVMGCQAMRSAYVAYAKNRPVFTVSRTPNGYRVKTLLPHLRLKLAGEEAREGEAGTTWELATADFFRATFVRGIYWWRFRPVTEGAAVDGPAPVDSESETFRRLCLGFSIAMLLFVTAVGLLPRLPSEAEQVARAPEVAFQPLVRKLRNYPKPMTIPETQPATNDSAPPELAAPAEPSPNRAERAAELAAKAAENAANAQAARAKAQEAAKAKAVAARAQALKELLGGAKALTSKEVALARPATPENGGSKGAADLLPSGATQVGQGTLLPSALSVDKIGRRAKVEAIGGQGLGQAGSGYSGTVDARVAGQGNSLVSVDESGTRVEEGLTKEEVGRVIQAHMSEIRYCYESSLLYQPKIEGKVQVDFTINAAGRVKRAAVQASTVNLPKLDQCVVARLQTWQFPRPKGGIEVSVSYPFLFKTLGRTP